MYSLSLNLSNQHNNLRITRILSCLSDFELYSHQMKFLEFLSKEIFETFELAPLGDSFLRFWINTIQDDEAREALKSTIMNYLNKDKFLKITNP